MEIINNIDHKDCTKYREKFLGKEVFETDISLNFAFFCVTYII